MKKYALIMIDMQGGFISPASPICIPSAAATVPACARAIDLCHAAGVPVVYATRHYRADGSDVENAATMSGSRAASRFPRSAFPKYPTLFRRNSSFCRRTTA